MYKIIGADKKEYGPVSAAQMHQWISEGRANSQTMVQAVGAHDWKPLSAFPEFADALRVHIEPLAPQPFATQTNGPVPTPESVLARDYSLDIGSCISRAWALVTKNFGPIVGISLLVLLVQGGINQVIGLFTRPLINDMVLNHHFTAGGILLIAGISMLGAPVYTVLTAGLFKYYLKMIRGQDASVSDAFSGFGPMAGQLILLGLVQSTLVLLASCLLILPGIYLSVAWYLAMPLVIDRQMKFWDAMEFSRKVISKHWFLFFGFLLIVGLVSISGVIACCVGIFFTMPVGFVAIMYAYEDIFSGPTGKIISRAKARDCMLLNLAGTPGLGSLVAGRRMEGLLQLAMSLLGFALFTIWIVKILMEYYGQISGNVAVQPVGWIGLTGGILFAAAWFWSLVTGLSVSREARDNEIAGLKQSLAQTPPKI